MILLGRFVRNRYMREPVILAALAGLFVLCGLLFGAGKQPAFAAANNGGLAPLGEIPPTAQQVIVGVYPISIYNIDYAGNTFYAEAYVWLRWKGEINPMATLEFANVGDQWGFILRPSTEEPEKLPDGSFYQAMRISGRFSQPFALERYPLDEQKLTILIEDTIHTSDELVYIADNKDSGYGDLLRVPGWRIAKWEIQSLLRSYDTLFGKDSSDDNSNQTTYAALRFQLTVDRSLSLFIWKLLLPLVIVLFMALAVCRSKKTVRLNVAFYP